MGEYGLTLKQARHCERMSPINLAALVNLEIPAGSLCAVGVLDGNQFSFGIVPLNMYVRFRTAGTDLARVKRIP